MRTDEAALSAAEHQLAHFKDILSAAYGCPAVDNIMDEGIYVYDDDLDSGFRVKRTHSSKSIGLPIVGACQMRNPQNVSVNNLSNNFHFYFLSLKLKQAIPAPFLWPISGLFGDVALSGHVTDRNFVTNFEKDYHNVKRLDKLSMSFGHPLQGAVVIRYLNEVSKLPVDEILNALLYKGRYGLSNRIGFGNVDDEAALIRLCGIEPGKGYREHDVENLNEDVFEKMNIDIYDIQNGRSSLHFTTKDFLPPLTCPTRDLLIKASQELQDAGVGESDSEYNTKVPSIPVRVLKSRHAREAQQERYPHRKKLNSAYYRVPLDTREFTINAPNAFDVTMTAFMLNNCLPQVLPGLQKWMNE
jgi:hypothetical protein